MAKYFRCEYCDRKIRTEVCPHCGGINELPVDTNVPSSTSDQQISAGKKKSTRFSDLKNKIKDSRIVSFFRKTFIIIGAAVTVIIIIGIILGFRDNVRLDYEDEYSDTLIKTEAKVKIDSVINGNSVSFELPCSLDVLSESLTLSPPRIYNPEKEDPNGDGIMDLGPYHGTSVEDTYNAFNFRIVNPTYDTVHFTDSICDSIFLSDPYKIVSSLKFNGTELLAPMDSIISAFGTPTYKYASTYSISLKYDTSFGRIQFYYDRDQPDSALPSNIDISNATISRRY